MSQVDFTVLESKLRALVCDDEAADVAHDVEHIERVVKTAKKLAQQEVAQLEVVVPAAWLHDCVSLPKSHPDRARASSMAGDKAIALLKSMDYPAEYLDAIHHAISAHSFSANIEPKTLEAKVVQDADRLDALGAIGVARCMQVSGALNRPLYASQDPFCQDREPDDKAYSIDHFYQKLLHIADSLNTVSAQQEGKRRESWMRSFLTQLGSEIV